MPYRESLRVGLMHWALPPTTGGVESHVADLALGLADLGCHVTVLTGESMPAPLRGVEIRSIPSLNLEVLGKNGSKTDYHEVKQAFRNIISSRRLQIVHGHNLHHFCATPAIALAELRLELGFTLHHTFHETWPDILRETPVYRQWEGNYAASRFVQHECLHHIGFEPELRPLGIDTERFRPTRAPMGNRETYVILHPARVLPWKGVHVSVEMLAELRRRSVPARLIITDTQRIIDWDEELARYRKQIVERIQEKSLVDLVEFVSVPYSEIHRLYEAADVVVYPTIGSEPYGLVPLEAMSMERPIVASRSGGMMETIIEGETGFLVDPDHAAALADRVEQLLRNPELAQRVGRAGRRHVVSHFNGRKFTERLLEEYLTRTARE